MKTVTQLEFRLLLKEQIGSGLDSVAAWRHFRSNYEQNGITGRTAGDREVSFKDLYESYQKFPASLTFDIRRARVEAFKVSLGEAFLTADIAEADAEDWFTTLEMARKHDRQVVDALELLEERDSSAANRLRDEARLLWDFWVQPEPDRAES